MIGCCGCCLRNEGAMDERWMKRRRDEREMIWICDEDLRLEIEKTLEWRLRENGRRDEDCHC